MNPISPHCLAVSRRFWARRGLFGAVLFAAVWLAPASGAADWEQGRGYRRKPLPFDTGGKAGFTRLLPAATGIQFTNLLAEERSIANRNLLSGSGLALGDFDGDGWCDIYFCGLDSPNVLYRNLGNWKFEDVTQKAGLSLGKQDSTGAVFADIDGDGDLDLLVTSLGGGVRLFRNNGKGAFTETTRESGLASKAGSMSMALADVDGDGDLDLYVANYRPTTIKDQPGTNFRITVVNGTPMVATVNGRSATAPDLTNRFVITPSGNVLELGEPHFLYLNNGKGGFSPVSFASGAFMDESGAALRELPGDWGLAVQMRDMNGDGAPDIYVCNDLFTPDRFWLNDGKGHFRAAPTTVLRRTPTFSMGVDFADIDRDGRVDFLVVDLLSRSHSMRQVQVADFNPAKFPPGLIDVRPQYSQNTLQWNRGDGTFADIGRFAGVEASEWSWCPIFLDVDLDGFEDILVSNGQWGDFQNIDMANRIEALKAAGKLSQAEVVKLVKLFPRLETPNVAFRNRGDRTFAEAGKEWGFDTPGISQGMALADLDNDGDMDVVVNNLNSAAGVYRNNAPGRRVAVRLKGLPPNTQGIGAKISVLGGPVPQSQEVVSGGRYLSGDDPMRVFAAGKGSMTLEVVWRGGKRSLVSGAEADFLYEISEEGATGGPAPSAPAPAPLFEDVSQWIDHRHHETPFDDFERQPLLPNRLSQLGPGVCWHDLDGNGWDDLIVGSGKGGLLAVFMNQGGGKFTRSEEPFLKKPLARDQTTVLGLNATLLVGSSNYEDGQPSGGALRVYDFKNKAAGDSVAGQTFSTGPMAFADIDGDGDLDLFVGGRCLPGRYPEAAPSILLRNDGGKLVVAQKFEGMGLACGAVFSDLDADGVPELIVACEWGPVRVFRQSGGRYEEASREWGTSGFTGLWQGVAAGDLDGDGKLDIVAANWGLNSAWQATLEHPRHLYFGNLGGGAKVDLVEAFFEESLGAEVPDRGFKLLSESFPFLREKYETHEAFGKGTLRDMFGEKLGQAGRLEINTLQSMVFLNRGGRFEARPLPAEAQFAPAFGVCLADLDGDGNEDVFLAQNFFSGPPDQARSDAGVGLLLRGDGKGGLQPLGPLASGIRVYGEQRGCALSDFDGDGRVDLAVAQNANQTKLFRNLGAAPGLRVRLKGGPGNPNGIGAALWIEYEGNQGSPKTRPSPLRELHAGSGYWSQDSAVTVLRVLGPNPRLHVRWPGGKSVSASIPDGAVEVSIDMGGRLEKMR